MSVIRAGVMVVVASLATVSVATTNRADARSGTPSQILSEAGRALSKTKTLHIANAGIDEDGRHSVFGDFTNTSWQMKVKAVRGKQAGEIRLVDRVSYFLGNASFWRYFVEIPRKESMVLAGRWIKVPVTAQDELALFTPKRLGSCLATVHGTLRKKLQTVGGRRMVVILDAGDKPGTAPQRIYIPASGTPLPARIVQTGPERKGGKNEPCGVDGKGDRTKVSDTRITKYNRPVKVTAPPGAIDLDNGGNGNPV